MITFFDNSDMVSFGNYLLSKDRRDLFDNNPNFPNGDRLQERLSEVHDSDFDNWKLWRVGELIITA